MRRLLLLLLVVTTTAVAQERWEGLELNASASATASTGDVAPLWLTANRHGVASHRASSAYVRVAVSRDLQTDSLRQWRLGYGLDIFAAARHERTAAIQQAYAELGWRKLRLTLGARERHLEVQNDELSSGAMTFGINASPVPTARLDIDWFAIPSTHGWWQWRLYGSYGLMTDGTWQEQFAKAGTRYARNTRYHEKSLHWQFGRPDRFPFTYEIGLDMASEFGGTSYNVKTLRANNNQLTTYHHGSGLRAYWNALTCQGSDATDGSNPNSSGNHLGNWVMQLRYHGQGWMARAYWQRFFEDHSQLTVQYGIHDMLLGGEVTLPRNCFVSSVVVEYLNTREQSGAVYHDATPSLPEAMAGRDDYYNHKLYAGWQYYGMAVGNPLITSPLYNRQYVNDREQDNLYFYNNRVEAWHIGMSGDPSDQWHWRALATFTRNWGIYTRPLDDAERQTSLMAEVSYTPWWCSGWQATLGAALDNGHLRGNSTGVQLTLSKSLKLN